MEAFITEWKHQVHGPDGKWATAVIPKQTMNNLAAMSIDTRGTYSEVSDISRYIGEVTGF